MGDAFGPDRALARLLALLDVRGRPDRVEGLVEAEPRIDVTRKFIGLGDDRFESRANEGVAVRLAARLYCFNPGSTVCCVAAPPPQRSGSRVEPSTGDLVSDGTTGMPP